MNNQKKYVNWIYWTKKDFNNWMPPFFKLKIDLEKMYQYIDEEWYLKLDMFQKKDNEKEYYFVLDEYENNNQKVHIEV